MAIEEWKPLDWIPGPHSYLVSSAGNVKRTATEVRLFNRLTRRMNIRKLPERVLKSQLNRLGYHIISLQTGRSSKHTYAVAPMVCRAFHGPPTEDRPHCAHLDGNPRNNCPTNLIWASRAENEAHKLLHGTRPMGSRHHAAKLDEASVLQIKKRLARERGADLAMEFGVSKSTVSLINRGKIWTHVQAA